MCAKLIHHAGIAKVLVVQDGYLGANGVQYLKDHGVEVEAHPGPRDPRLSAVGVADSPEALTSEAFRPR